MSHQGAVKQAKMPKLNLGLFIRAQRRARFEVTDVNRKIRTLLIDSTDQRFVGRIALCRLTIRQVTQGHKAKRLGRHNLGCGAQERKRAPAFAKRSCAYLHMVAKVQLCSATRSSFLLNTHDSARNTISMTMPIPEKASFNSFSEIWPNAWPAERTTPDQIPAATKLNTRNVDQDRRDIPKANPATPRIP